MIEPRIELKPCPFCGGTDFDKYRFARRGYLGKPAWFEEKSPIGEWFRVECNGCGCTYDEHEDGLYDRFYDIYDYEAEFTEEAAWDMMANIWNDRAPAPVSNQEDYYYQMAKKGEWSGSYETDVMIACAKKVLEEKEKDKEMKE